PGSGTPLSAHRVPVLAGHDIVAGGEVAVSQSRSERGPGAGRVRNVLYRDGINELLGDPASAVPEEAHAAMLIEGHAQSPYTAVQTVMRQVAQFVGDLLLL